ncbi:MAG: hypothetical protein ACFFAJ_13715 [Candidatus Hodarchaeota archaeon]
MKDSCETEIKELHKFFENWYNGVISQSEKTFSRLTRVLARNFKLISP